MDAAHHRVRAALQTHHAPFGYLTWLQTALWAAFGNLLGGIVLVTVLRILQVPERIAGRRANPEAHA